jgi:hypothetical protein
VVVRLGNGGLNAEDTILRRGNGASVGTRSLTIGTLFIVHHRKSGIGLEKWSFCWSQTNGRIMAVTTLWVGRINYNYIDKIN